MTRPHLDVGAVTALVEEVAAAVVTPRFRALREGDVHAKGLGDDVVTVVDHEAEALLAAGLSRLLPGVPVVGEEDVAAHPELLGLLVDAPLAWVVDPLDGTRGFVAGSPDHSVMVGLVEHGRAVAGWIHQPEHGVTFVAEQGSGAFANGARLSRTAPSAALADLRGGVATRYLSDDLRASVADAGFGPGLETSLGMWSGLWYPKVATGEADFALFWRTWPWDHTPGAVLVREVGGVSRRLDGTDYRPGVDGTSLLVAADDATWHAVRGRLGAVSARP